jgi:hypothetical protein
MSAKNCMNQPSCNYNLYDKWWENKGLDMNSISEIKGSMWTHQVCYTYGGHTVFTMKLNIGRKQWKHFTGEEEWWTLAQVCASRNLINNQKVQLNHALQ